jgi:hypothetical protein
MTNKTQIKVGDVVNAIVSVWTENENPTEANFFTGKVKSIIRKSEYGIYIQIEKLDRQIPADRVTLAA